jgi:hypothetical protein
VKNRRPEPDDRPPICPACGVTMGIVIASQGTTRFVCLECGFLDEEE